MEEEILETFFPDGVPGPPPGVSPVTANGEEYLRAIAGEGLLEIADNSIYYVATTLNKKIRYSVTIL